VDLLKRNLAPILPDAWKLIDQEATRVLKLHLAGRKVVDFQGPHGWAYAAVNTGRLALLGEKASPSLGVAMGIREVQPLVEVRVPIQLATMELDTVARGAEDPDLTPVVRAAEQIALCEDTAIFGGLARAGIKGILESSPHSTIPLPTEVLELPKAIVSAKETLRRAGVSGPYVLLLGSALHDQVFAASEEGYPLVKRIQQLVDKPIVRAEAITGAAVLSMRGGDYELTVGQDLSLGYAYHTKDQVELYLTESFTFRVLETAAAVRINRTAERAPVSSKRR
jgi:uncharacterized linocin/CFP29 family protein